MQAQKQCGEVEGAGSTSGSHHQVFYDLYTTLSKPLHSQSLSFLISK